MKKNYNVEVSKTIHASQELVYRVIIDMNHHRNFLPKEFESLDILRGGKGAGTIVRLNINVMGKKVSYIITISEPVPGRVIKEEDGAAGVVTTWTITPLDDGRRCNLQLSTDFGYKSGFAGFM